MSILDYLRQRVTPPNIFQHPPSPWVRNLERNLLAFDGMVDLFDTPETEPLRERITPTEPRRSLLTSFKFFQLVTRPASQPQERPRPLTKPDRLVVYKRYASNFFINASSYIDFTIRPRLGELFPGVFGQYDFDLLGLGAQGREVTTEFKDPKSEMYLQMSLAKKISRGVRSAGREVRRSSRKTAKAVTKGTKKTGKWIKENPGKTVAIVVVATVVTIAIIASGGAAAAAVAAGGAAGGGAAAAGSKKKEDEEKPRPVAPPPASPPPPLPLPPAQPISREPIGLPPAVTQPFTVSPPDCLNIPPEYRLPPSFPNMPVPVPPIGSPHVPSYQDSVNPITSVPQPRNPGLSPQAGRMEPPRTTSPVIQGPSGVGLGSSESEKARSEDFQKSMNEFTETLKGAGAKIAYPFVVTADAVNRTKQEAEMGLRNLVAISQGKSQDEFLKEEKEYQDFVRKIQKESPGISALLGVRNNDSLTDSFLELTGGRGPGENIVERAVQGALATGHPAGAVPAVGREIQDGLGIKLHPVAQSAVDALEFAYGIKSGRNILPVEATGLKGRQAVVLENAAASEVQATAAAPKVLRTEPVAPLAQESGALKKPNVYAPDRPLPRTEHGDPIPETDAPHTQLGVREGSKGTYVKAIEFDKDGNPVRIIEFTDHGRPHNHTNPHQHLREPNPTGGTRTKEDAEPLPEWEYEKK